MYADVFEPARPRLASRRPIWSDMTSVDTVTQQRQDWSSASVLNHTIVTDPTIRQPGFHLPCIICDCGQRQTMNHIVDTCPLTTFDGGLNLLHEAYDDDTVTRLESTVTAALVKYSCS